MSFSRCHHLTRALLRLVPLALLLAGCASPPRTTTPLHVAVSSTGMVTYRDSQFRAEQLPGRLAKNGVSVDQEIRLHVEDTRQTGLMAQLRDVLLRNGYKHILFVTETRAMSEVSGQPETRTATPVRAPIAVTPTP
jgi:hypothetical protein